ncbi:MAG: hypothetical protein RL274_2721, partial [Pseudomonadota bacterium]
LNFDWAARFVSAVRFEFIFIVP